MGSCLSKKGSPFSSNSVAVSSAVRATVLPVKPAPKIPQGNAAPETHPPRPDHQGLPNLTPTPKKEVFLIKHRKSHDRDPSPIVPKLVDSTDSSQVTTRPSDNHQVNNMLETSSGLRTSSCTKEEVDAILIQCGRLSRSSSGNCAGRTYSGSKRSYDFDNHDDADVGVAGSVPRGRHFPVSSEEDPGQRRPRCRQSRPSPTRDQGVRRRTPSRERDQQRSSSASRERRVSRSPVRRAENTTNSSLSNAPVNCTGSKLPAKMVSVPATVSGADKTKMNVELKATAVRRIPVKRNHCAGDTTRATASPRSQSPVKQTTLIAKAADNDRQQQLQLQPQPSLSRNSSRKAEKSPYRRNPLGEIDPNTSPHPQPSALLATNNKYQAPANKENEALRVTAKPDVVDKWKCEMAEDARALEEVNAAGQGILQKEPFVQASTVVDVDLDDIHQTLERIKSSRDFGVEKDHREGGSYTSLLLQDIQKFHQNQAAPPSFSLPPCVVKACSIYDAVAGLNSKRSCVYDGLTASSSGNNDGAAFINAKSEAKDPFVESELAVDDDLVEPSILKYVTLKRGGGVLGREEEQESSGSNTLFLGSTDANSSLSNSPNCGTSISAGSWRSAVSGKLHR
ncbi:hypothetical protein MLD38_025579 [Melastoma candidum]|uniref:Uncharacterized protein n=1 Tax=Melastoma candidum TaxID=119954 RepID=A0ACB9NYN9_9MYRT|nr:hypothetical protein MLD38_025579 [Melastoma candidum]